MLFPPLAGSVSAGVSVPSRAGQKQNCFWHRVSLIFQGVFSIVARGQKQKDLNTWSTLISFQAASQRHVLSDLLDPRRGSFDTRSDPLRSSQPLCFRCFPPLVYRVYRITLALPHC